jgi:hypothetical protein
MRDSRNDARFFETCHAPMAASETESSAGSAFDAPAAVRGIDPSLALFQSSSPRLFSASPRLRVENSLPD